MKKKEWNEGLDHLDPDLIEKYLEQKDRLRQNKAKKKIWLRLSAVAACLAILVGAVMVVPMLREDINSPVPSIATVKSGSKIIGKAEILYGDPTSEDFGEADMMAPGFEIQMVIEAEIVEILPDTYYSVINNRSYHVAKLRVVDQIFAEELPMEIFLRYSYYGADVFDGYDSFIMSVEQIGIENYALVNEEQSRIDYF